MINFFSTEFSLAQVDDFQHFSVDRDYPYWLGGAINWVAQTYLILREYREDLILSAERDLEDINIAHVTSWRSYAGRLNEYRVSIRADYRRLWDIDHEILQNSNALKMSNQSYITYWPIPRLIPRDCDRTKIENVAYAGRIGRRNIADLLREENSQPFNKLAFKIISREEWHDMSKIDILLAIRDFSFKTYDEKPPSKLINAWHAGIPLIAGFDSAFSSIGEPGVDYIHISSVAELYEAIDRLQQDHEYYKAIVEAGKAKAKKFTREKIAQSWLDIIDHKIMEDYEMFRLTPTRNYVKKAVNHIIDSAYNRVSAARQKF